MKIPSASIIDLKMELKALSKRHDPLFAHEPHNKHGFRSAYDSWMILTRLMLL